MFILVFQWLAKRSYHLRRCNAFKVVVYERLRPAWFVKQFTELIPVHRKIIVVLVTLLYGLDGVAIVVGVGREILATILEVVRFEGNGTTIEIRIVFENTSAINKHGVGSIEVAHWQPVGIVQGY